jgi:hypothetical protein
MPSATSNTTEIGGLDLSEISRIYRTMRAMCEAVIAAGGSTKW